jgi:hypothetical protein
VTTMHAPFKTEVECKMASRRVRRAVGSASQTISFLGATARLTSRRRINLEHTEPRWGPAIERQRRASGERDDNFGSGLIDPLKALQLADPRTATRDGCSKPAIDELAAA